jgi:hypothetical protein
VTERGQVHAKLMLPAALRREGHQGCAVATRKHAVARDRRVALSFRSHFHQDVEALFGAVQRERDAAGIVRHFAPDDGEVALTHATIFEVDLEGSLGRAGPAAQNQAARFPIEAVRDLRSVVAVALPQ